SPSETAHCFPHCLDTDHVRHLGTRRNAERAQRGMVGPCKSLCASALAPGPRAARWWPTIVATLVLWRHRRRSRRDLAMLDDRELADIGLSSADRWSECRKRLWEPRRLTTRPLGRALFEKGVHAFAEIGAGVGVADQVVDILVAQPGLEPTQRLLGGPQRDRRVAG